MPDTWVHERTEVCDWILPPQAARLGAVYCQEWPPFDNDSRRVASCKGELGVLSFSLRDVLRTSDPESWIGSKHHKDNRGNCDSLKFRGARVAPLSKGSNKIP